jgi:pimeloyl-ACP methyl ester carboxylesterase
VTILSTSAGTVAYDSQGSGNLVVLAPSGDHQHHDYDEIRDLLPGRFRSIGVDWPGQAHSPAGTSPSTELRLRQIVEELLDPNARGHRPGVGNSAGGKVAARLAIRRPDLVKGLVIIDGGFEGSRLLGRVFCALMNRCRFTRRIHPLFSWAYTRPRAAVDRAAKAARDLIPGSGLVVTEGGRLPHTTSPAAVAAELTSPANTAFEAVRRTNDTQHSSPAAKEQE